MIGTRYRCMDVTCLHYDLCESCMALGVHNPEHRFITAEKDADDDITRGDVRLNIIVSLCGFQLTLSPFLDRNLMTSTRTMMIRRTTSSLA